MQYILTVGVSPAGSGTTTPAAGTYFIEESVLVTTSAQPAAGYEFDHWDVDGDGLVQSWPLPSNTFAMPSHTTIIAVFIVVGSRVSVGSIPGQNKIATVVLTNRADQSFDYDASLSLGIDAIAISVQSFHLNAGEQKNVSFPIQMPSVGALYPVLLSVSVGGNILTVHRAPEDMLVVGPSAHLLELQVKLRELADEINTWGEDAELFVHIPGYGLVAGVTWDTYALVVSLMRVEAVAIRMMDSTGDAYFTDNHMYLTDGTLMV